MADAFPDDDAPAVMATPGPTGKAPIPAVSRGAVVGPARASLAHQNRIKTYDCFSLPSRKRALS